MQLDGDMAEGILQTNGVAKIFNDPFGVNVLIYKDSYPNPNRFFAHFFTAKYFRSIPFILQKFTNPIDSIYLSCAIAKTAIQFILIYLLALYITGIRNLFKKEFIIAAALITPLFQTNGYQNYMGIINNSMTYTFFYAFPIIFILIYLHPFFKEYFQNKLFKSSLLLKLTYLIIAIIISLSGPLNPGIILIIASLMFLHKWKNDYIKFKESPFTVRIIKTVKKLHKISLFFFCQFVFSRFTLYTLDHLTQLVIKTIYN